MITTQNQLTTKDFFNSNSNIDGLIVPFSLLDELDLINEQIGILGKKSYTLNSLKDLLNKDFEAGSVIFVPVEPDPFINEIQSVELFRKIRRRLKLVLLGTETASDYSAQFYARMNWFRLTRMVS